MSTTIDDDKAHAAMTVYCEALALVDDAYFKWTQSRGDSKQHTAAVIAALLATDAAIDYVTKEGDREDLALFIKGDLL